MLSTSIFFAKQSNNCYLNGGYAGFLTAHKFQERLSHVETGYIERLLTVNDLMSVT